MQLDEMFIYKNRLVRDLLTDEKIVGLLADGASVANASSFVYSQVFPFEYIPDTVETGKTYICCDVDIQKSINSTFLKPVIYVWVFTHKSLLRLPEGGVRTDALCSAIANKINGSREYGLGELELYSVKRFAPIADYQGKIMTFNATEINRFAPNRKVIPSNRRDGV